MSKLIIYVKGNPNYEGQKRGDFVWSKEHGCYIWKGKVLTEAELNVECEKAMAHYPKILHPSVKVVEFSGDDLTEPAEITVAQAEDVMQRLAPHRLKQKSGPKPHLVEA